MARLWCELAVPEASRLRGKWRFGLPPWGKTRLDRLWGIALGHGRFRSTCWIHGAASSTKTRKEVNIHNAHGQRCGRMAGISIMKISKIYCWASAYWGIPLRREKKIHSSVQRLVIIAVLSSELVTSSQLTMKTLLLVSYVSLDSR